MSLDADGGVNCVLGLLKKECVPDNGSCWLTSNSHYYNLNLDKFEGYIELEE